MDALEFTIERCDISEEDLLYIIKAADESAAKTISSCFAANALEVGVTQQIFGILILMRVDCGKPGRDHICVP